MKITDVKVSVFEVKGLERLFTLEELPGMRRETWTHRVASTSPGVLQVMHVLTDEGVEGVCTVGPGGYTPPHYTRALLEQLKALVVGENPLHRERLYQKLHRGTRWLYREPGWFGTFDNCLWDIAGKAAGLPVWALIGRVRDRAPAYLNIRGDTPEEAGEDARRAVSLGFPAVKDHFYHAPEENVRWFEAVREAVGDGIDIMHDAVAIYTYDEALRVGRALERLGYRWFEEPLAERQMNLLRRLCDALDIPVMASETFMNDVDMCAQWLIHGATDLVRANARHGTTAVLKLAHLAELHGTTVELNGVGGLFGLVHAHLLCCIANTSYYEYFGGRQESMGREVGMLNPLEPVQGYVAPPDGPGWGAEWDRAFFEKRRVAVL